MKIFDHEFLYIYIYLRSLIFICINALCKYNLFIPNIKKIKYKLEKFILKIQNN